MGMLDVKFIDKLGKAYKPQVLNWDGARCPEEHAKPIVSVLP